MIGAQTSFRKVLHSTKLPYHGKDFLDLDSKAH